MNPPEGRNSEHIRTSEGTNSRHATFKNYNTHRKGPQLHSEVSPRTHQFQTQLWRIHHQTGKQQPGLQSWTLTTRLGSNSLGSRVHHSSVHRRGAAS
ncbi:hypothetical protein CR201_G0018949 [Pongo abelii]|uniref:Uncharacterized protein n=1 Tax=Pongo abelii TaxID=9601 RepID=A0A2J8VFE0_PONAB|nr:hypothetical protein CR201_G0018949 [Pongo abelii]